MPERTWDNLWKGFNGVKFSDSTYMLRFYELLLGTSNFKGKNILEIGCGTGINSILMAKKGANITLIDSSKEALKVAKSILENLSLDAEIVYGDVFEYDFKGEYDIVHSEGLVEHFLGKKRQKIFDIHTMAAKRNGRVVIIAPNSSCLPYRIGKFFAEKTKTWAHGAEYPFTRNEFVFRIKRSGLEMERLMGGEFVLGFGWLFTPIWISSYTKLLNKGLRVSANGAFFHMNYNNFLANRFGRVIGAVGIKSPRNTD